MDRTKAARSPVGINPLRLILDRATAWRQAYGQYVELQERRRLLSQPWQEEFVHFGLDGRLHGDRIPGDNRRRSTTRSGWCPGWSRDQAERPTS